MKTIIAGGRRYALTPEDLAWLDGLKASLPITEVVCGCASGADRGGAEWAGRAKVPVKYFAADWEREGWQAGPIRNQRMADYADACVLFPGGRGTADMLRKAEAVGRKIIRHPDRASEAA